MCNSARAGSGYCQAAGTAGGPCSHLFNAIACPAGTGCLNTSAIAATCTAARPETEPNDTPTTPQGPVAGPTVFTGSVNTPGDRADCFRVNLPENGVAVIDLTVAGDPTCSSYAAASLYYGPALSVREVGGDGRHSCAYMVVRAPPAGSYVVCVSGTGARPVMNYQLAIGTFTR